MNKCIPNVQKNIQMVPKWLQNAPPRASKCGRRPEDGSRGAKMVSTRPTRGFKGKFGVQKGTPKRVKMEPQNVSKNNTDFNTEKNQTETHGRAVREPRKHQERIQKKLKTQLWAQRKISKKHWKIHCF